MIYIFSLISKVVTQKKYLGLAPNAVTEGHIGQCTLSENIICEGEKNVYLMIKRENGRKD